MVVDLAEHSDICGGEDLKQLRALVIEFSHLFSNSWAIMYCTSLCNVSLTTKTYYAIYV